jgi:hypothetical protein
MSIDLHDELTERDAVRWRRDRLVGAGYPLPLARRIAADAGYDLHVLVDLVARGCPPPLAARILAPLEHRDAA